MHLQCRRKQETRKLSRFIQTLYDFANKHIKHMQTRCKAKPDCSPPGYSPRRLLIIACVQRSTCTYCSIPSHASVGENARGGKCPWENIRSQGAQCSFPVYWCCQQKSSRSTLRITLTTVERVVDECTKFITHWSLRRQKLCGLNKKKLVVMATSLERSQPHFTSVIYVWKATNPENFAKIGRVLSQTIGHKPIVNTGSSFDS